MNFLFGSAPDIEISINDEKNLPKAWMKNEKGDKELMTLFTGRDTVSGEVKINPHKNLDHLGIKIELIGQIEVLYDRNNPYEFTSLVRELEPPGGLAEAGKTYKYEFKNVDKQYESFSGNNVCLRFFLRVKITRPAYASNITQIREFAVQNVQEMPEANNSIKMEVGIEDCLHIEFEYNQSKYSLQDVVVGKIYFLLVRIKIKHMEVVIIKRESTGTGPDAYNENENLAKFEIMDGAPVRGESIPVRLFLAPYNLTPTMKNVHNKFSVKYFLNLVLIDEEDRRYFKQQEILLWRKDLDVAEGNSTTSSA